MLRLDVSSIPHVYYEVLLAAMPLCLRPPLALQSLTVALMPMQADKSLLEAVRVLQTRLRASDGSVAVAVNEHARANVEAALTRAIDVMQLRGQKRDVSPAIAVRSSSWHVAT